MPPRKHSISSQCYWQGTNPSLLILLTDMAKTREMKRLGVGKGRDGSDADGPGQDIATTRSLSLLRRLQASC